MNATTYGALFAGGLFLGMLVLLEIGRRVGVRQLAQNSEGIGVVDGAMFALLGLLIAFTFSGAATRFDARRHLIIEEANNIGTAYLRIDLLRPEAQPALRELFRQYVDLRLEVYQKMPDLEAAKTELAHSIDLQRKIWDYSVVACQESGSSPAHMLLLSALNEMIDITTTRTEVAQIHPPWIIYAMLGVLSLAAALLAGHGMAGNQHRSWIHIVGFAAILALTVYVIIDIEYPRLGLFRVEGADRVLVEVRRGMN